MGDLRITRAAVGRVARLGDLYDAREDRFISMRSLRDILKKKDVCETMKDESRDEENSSGVGFLITNSDNESGPNSKHDSCFDNHFDAVEDKYLGASALEEPLNKEVCEEKRKSPTEITTSSDSKKFEKHPNSRLYLSSGDNFDTKEGEQLSANAFKESLNEDCVWEEVKMSTDIVLIASELVREQFEKLGIDTELSLSIMSDMVNLSGSSAYLNSQYRSGKSAHMTLVYSVKTKFQEVEGIRSKVNVDYLECEKATHIVDGIQWGAKCSITCEYRSNGNEDEEQVEGKLKEEMTKLTMALSEEGDAKVHSSKICGNDYASKFSYHIHSDLENHKRTTFQGALDAVASLQNAVLGTNGGKGVPIAYRLLQLSYLRKRCGLEKSSGAIIMQIEKNAVDNFFQIMQVVKEAQQQINNLLENLGKNEDAVSLGDVKSARGLRNAFDNEVAELKSHLATNLIEARSGSKNRPSKPNYVQKFSLGDKFFPYKFIANIKKFDDTVQKLQVINEFKDKNVLYIGNRGSIEEILETAGIVYVLYMDHRTSYTCAEEWQKQIALFSRLVTAHRNDSGVRLAVFDCELHENCIPKKGTCIRLYRKEGKCWQDLPQGVDEDIEECIIEMAVGDSCMQKSQKVVMLEIRCPRSFHGICKSDECHWICRKCKEVVEYGIDDDLLYCKCGRACPFESRFRCNDIQHGLVYADFSEMRGPLSSWKKTVKETNIIVMGETGVGKSTWINAIANYLSYPTLQDAIDAKDMKVCIPSTFTHNSKMHGLQTISVGSASENEIQETGHSATQLPRAYRFDVGKHLITLLDTPGIGDVRGLARDEINFENILSHLSHYDEIHGICLLLKTNASRLTVLFRFCVMELLRHLHKSAVHNIIFCFTHTRASFYQPGEALATLQKLLGELKGPCIPLTKLNQFCFENEAFRLLACMKNGIEFSRQDIAVCSSSWDQSLKETRNLISYVQTLMPHPIQSTVCLNNARRTILELSKPLAETAATIQANIDRAEAKSLEVTRSEETKKKLQDQLYLYVSKLERIPLEHPRTVCTDTSCTRYVEVQLLLCSYLGSLWW